MAASDPADGPLSGGGGNPFFEAYDADELAAVWDVHTQFFAAEDVAPPADALSAQAEQAGAGELLSMHEQIMAACEEADEAAAVREAEGEPE